MKKLHKNKWAWLGLGLFLIAALSLSAYQLYRVDIPNGKLPRTSCGTIVQIFSYKISTAEKPKLTSCFINAHNSGSKASLNYEFRGVDTYEVHTFRTQNKKLTDDYYKNFGGSKPIKGMVDCQAPMSIGSVYIMNCGGQDKVFLD